MRMRNRKNMRRNLSAWCLALLAAGCASAQQPPATTAPPASGYVLGPDDQIIISAMEGLDLADKAVFIGTNGNITLPLIGRVQAAGLTLEQLEADSREKSGYRVIVNVEMLNRAVAVEIERDLVRPIAVPRLHPHLNFI